MIQEIWLITKSNTSLSSMQVYIESLDRELAKRYPSVVEEVTYESGETVHNSIVHDCLLFFDARFIEETQKKYDLFLDYLKGELTQIEVDLQSMQFSEDKYFSLLHCVDFAPSMIYEKSKMENLLRYALWGSYGWTSTDVVNTEVLDRSPLDINDANVIADKVMDKRAMLVIPGSTSKLTNTMHLFAARGCRKAGEQHLDENEHIDVMSVPFDEAIEMVMSGKINANSSAHALLKVSHQRGKMI